MTKICKSFGEKQVLNGITLTLTPGEITCLMGESGIGKTTLINIIAGLIKPDSGSIRGLDDKKISIVFQEDRLLEWETALTNVLFVANLKNTAIELLTLAGLSDSLNKKAAELSGGMKRRVSVCRALMVDFDLLILDEPFKGLDSTTKPVIIDMVKKYLQKDKYILCVTHDLHEVEMLGGRLVTLNETN